MTSFQIASFVLLGLALAATITLWVRRRATARTAFLWSLLWIGAAVAIARPQLTVKVANALGIARGADLVLYLAVLGMFLGFFAVYVRMRRFETEMTRIVRELALRGPKEPDQTGERTVRN